MLCPLRRRGAGLIFDLHDPAPELFEAIFHRRGLIHRVLVALERRAARSADVTMTVNEPCAALLRGRDGVDGERVYVLVTSPDPRSFFPVEPRPELRRGHEQLVLWLGRMSRKENLPLLIDVADEIVNTLRRDDVCFALVGDGDVRPELEAEVERRGLSGAVVFPGMADDNRLREWMTTADVCVSLDKRNPMNDRSLDDQGDGVHGDGPADRPVPARRDAARLWRCECVRRRKRSSRLRQEDRPTARRPGAALAARRGSTGAPPEVGLTWPQQVPILVRAVDHSLAIRGGREIRRAGGLVATPSATEETLLEQQEAAAG